MQKLQEFVCFGATSLTEDEARLYPGKQEWLSWLFDVSGTIHGLGIESTSAESASRCSSWTVWKWSDAVTCSEESGDDIKNKDQGKNNNHVRTWIGDLNLMARSDVFLSRWRMLILNKDGTDILAPGGHLTGAGYPARVCLLGGMDLWYVTMPDPNQRWQPIGF